MPAIVLINFSRTSITIIWIACNAFSKSCQINAGQVFMSRLQKAYRHLISGRCAALITLQFDIPTLP